MSKELPLSSQGIENRIFTIRGVQVMLDEDLAEIYGIPTGRLNEQVKRNVDRFPTDFMFQLSKEEWENLKSQNGISSWGGRRKLPLVFTEQGVAGLSGVIKSEIAVKVHVAIMRAFVALRKMVQDNQLIISRLDRIELKQLETDQKFDKVFKALDNKDSIPSQGVLLDGQVQCCWGFIELILWNQNLDLKKVILKA
ncbi:ORF6N domain-containing protein [Algoriphagus alkaliphilus]|uniref:ORF6N domain-containing protein n=1 Tax=Algoriphagus alkaliphilus TaxID=279824 RepID=A0A1G5Z5M3_9BACT|nr:ORF6N domain-containing protein [Algoriphagus alkaliphilus]MBA4298662.1 hypothetical protein [Cyclobacterium sp.]SDA89645.1 ORF6N domain-containing protein [Algoriphagus alkaliphilus]